MRRSMKLICKLLEYAEEMTDGFTAVKPPEFNDYSGIEVSYHIRLCDEAGYMAKANHLLPKGDHDRYMIVSLTWQGHEALDAMRQNQNSR